MPNKRASKRQFVRTKVRFGRTEPSSLGNTFNVSPKGIGITTSRLFPKNAKLICDIYVNKAVSSKSDSDQQVIRTQGRVAWIKQGFPGQPSKMGIKILDPNINLTDFYES
ncbi:MAG: PilZ domain-containing protein [Candidatus Dadabacteria bacterium]|nr:PilZ domain-containing protein [Candidatus Dadabacteria bacterium]NIS07223.1 PilZ domain-containing protein [Candidatus Dadabacteria bacterium]NIV40930.1 hypothetical protein [Candidatus Dadabacteria bacterium]NIX14362.1 hypothetical protein [Candidatus Dadabacteria bacterium]NIY20880.1 hypothetical protein [Candidatus Dadabacteria bacterium]